MLTKYVINLLSAKRENVRYRSWRILWNIREKTMPQKFRHDPYETNEIYWVNPKKICYRTLKEFNYLKDHNKVSGGGWENDRGIDGLCNPVYIDDLVDSLFLGVKIDQRIGETSIISGEHPISWNEFYGALANWRVCQRQETYQKAKED